MSKNKGKRKEAIVWDGMSRKQHKNLAQYIQRMAATLGLREWKIKLMDEHTAEDGDSDALATISSVPGRHYAEIRVAKDFNSFSYQDKKTALIHELVHCHQQRLLLWADDTLREVLGTVGYEIFNAAYRDNYEHMVDDLAVVFARVIDDSPAKHLLKGN
jgi:hypothetical protein